MADHATPATTRELADFVVRTNLTELPDAVRHEGLRAFLNWVGCALGGCRYQAVEIAIAAAEEFSGEKRATVVGRGRLLDGINAAFINCLASSAHSYDDTHLATVTHPTGPVAAALLALAERQTVAGGDFLTALVLGIEIECRISNALLVPPARGQIAWYVTGVTGGIGAATAAAKVLGLDRQKTIWALGIAATQAAGFRQTHASMCSRFVPAHAARCGLQAALLAARGFTCTDQSIEGPRGFATVFAEAANLAAATDGLGATWETLANTYKPFPCGIVIHPAIDACLQIVNASSPAPDDISRIRLGVHPLCLTLCDRPVSEGAEDAAGSVRHWAARRACAGRRRYARGRRRMRPRSRRCFPAAARRSGAGRQPRPRWRRREDRAAGRARAGEARRALCRQPRPADDRPRAGSEIHGPGPAGSAG